MLTNLLEAEKFHSQNGSKYIDRLETVFLNEKRLFDTCARTASKRQDAEFIYSYLSLSLSLSLACSVHSFRYVWF